MNSSLVKKTDPTQTVLAVIDVQNDFIHSDGEMARSGTDVTLAPKMVPTLLDFISTAREYRVPILYTQATHSPWTDTPTWRSRHKAGRDTDHFCRPNTWGWEFYMVRPAPDELVILKPRWDSFIWTSLELNLRAKGAKCVIATGVATGGCVEATVMHAGMLDFEVVVLDDCTATSSSEKQNAALVRMARIATVASSKDIKEAWAKTKFPPVKNGPLLNQLQTV